MSTSTVDTWSGRLRHRILTLVPEGQLLPDRQPAYVASWIYLFGVLTLTSLVVVIATGVILTFGGVTWWHTSGFGHFVNSLHLWSVELLFLFMSVHFWGKFFMAAWRGKRHWTWISGGLAFLLSIFTAFTGYVSQTNFDSQWIAAQAKDGLNSMSVGAVINVLNPGQALLLHAALMPLIVGAIVVLHVIQVRRRGVVPPIGLEPGDMRPSAAAPAERAGE